MKNDTQKDNHTSPPKKPSVIKAIGVGILSYFGASLPSGIIIGPKMAKVIQENDITTPERLQEAKRSNTEFQKLQKTSRIAGLASLAVGIGAGTLYYRRAKKAYNEKSAELQQMQGEAAPSPKESYTGIVHKEDMQPTTTQQDATFQTKAKERETASAGMGKG